MKRIVRLTESDLSRIVRRIIKESESGISKLDMKVRGKEFTIIDPSCGLEIMEVVFRGAACETQTEDGLGCNSILEVVDMSNNPRFFENGPEEGCNKKLHKFLYERGENWEPGMDTKLELFYDCEKNQLYLRGKQKFFGGMQKFEIECSELEDMCYDSCDVSDDI